MVRDGAAFAAALASDHAEIRAAAIRHADFGWRSTNGRTVLHVAAALSSVEAVAGLLDRGIDVLSRDQEGATAFDVAQRNRQQRPQEVDPVIRLLEARGGCPPRVEVTDHDYAVGASVCHKQFGAGVVEAATGAGELAKLTIRFDIGSKVLVAKFVTRA